MKNHHRTLLVAAVAIGALVSVPAPRGLAQDGPDRTGGLGTITTGVNAGPASQSDTGTDGNIQGPTPDFSRIPGVGVRPASESAADPFPGPAIVPGPALPVAGEAPPISGATTDTAPGTTTDAAPDPGAATDAATDAAPVTEVATDSTPGDGTVPVEITESSTNTDESAIGEAPAPSDAPATDVAVTDDASGDGRREGRRDEAAANSDGETTTLDGSAPAPAPTTGDACGYPSWIEAQSALEKDATLADALDPDGDGIACEEAMY